MFKREAIVKRSRANVPGNVFCNRVTGAWYRLLADVLKAEEVNAFKKPLDKTKYEMFPVFSSYEIKGLQNRPM